MKTKTSQQTAPIEVTRLSPEEMDERQHKNLITAFNRRIATARATLAKFSADLADAPCFAMEWSLSSFTAAAQVNVFSQIARALENKAESETYAAITARLNEFCQNEVNQKSKNPTRSTSPTASVLAQEILAAWAEAIEVFSWEK